MSEGEFKKRAVNEAVIDVDDIKQTITKDRVLMVEVPEEKYMVRMKDLFAWFDEAKKEFPIKFTWQVMTEEHQNGNSTYDERVMPNAKLPENRANAHINKNEVIDWFLKWFGEVNV
jgi:hypothetical protein